MGYAVSWLAVRTDASDELLQSAGLSITGEIQSDPEAARCLQAVGSWRVIFSNKMDKFPSELLQELSSETEAVVCSLEEHVMESSVEYWANGHRVFSVLHKSENGIYDLGVQGSLPAEHSQIHQEAKARQDAEGGVDADVDYIFDVPIEIAENLTGFNHTRYSGEEQWQVLEESAGGTRLRSAGCFATVSAVGAALVVSAFAVNGFTSWLRSP